MGARLSESESLLLVRASLLVAVVVELGLGERTGFRLAESESLSSAARLASVLMAEYGLRLTAVSLLDESESLLVQAGLCVAVVAVLDLEECADPSVVALLNNGCESGFEASPFFEEGL